ncbi:MAG: YajQ family cyclic di-GMP-binding protein [Bacteroidota bacterium]
MAATSYSFDITSEVDMQEVDNAINQAQKELTQRYDLRGSNAELEFNKTEKKIKIKADGEHFVDAIREIVHSKMHKRGVSILSFEAGKIEFTGGKTVFQSIEVKSGLEKEQAKKITQIIKDSKVKVTTQIQDEQVRVTGKDKDDLQKAIQAVRGNSEIDFPVQFVNMR